MRALSLLLALVACGPDDIDTDTDLPDRPEPEGCEQTDLFVDGRDTPQVGDTWTVTMRCDGATLLGPMALRVEPVELGRVDENTVTWVQPGTGQIRVQVGSYVERRDVTVTD